MASELRRFVCSLEPAWGDYNGHLRDAFYALVFSYATDALMDHIGLDAAGRAETGHSLYTLECHLNFLQEVQVGKEVCVQSQILAADSKRLHIHHAMFLWDGLADASDRPAATLLAASEQMLLNVDTQAGKSSVFAPEVKRKVEALAAQHASLARPEHVGRLIRLP